MRNKWRIFLMLIIMQQLLAAYNLKAQVRLPRLVSDSMVLQRDRPVVIWGWASPREEVVILFNNKQYKTIANTEGKWIQTLSPVKAGGPYKMKITASNEIMLKGILAGDVWLCSGQSNMEMIMDRIKDKYPAEIAGSDNSYIRQFGISAKKYSFSPQDDVQGQWVSANPQTVLKFTAAGYFFARNLYEKYKVPVGLINSSWGGTPAEAWISEEGLHHFPDYASTSNAYKDTQLVRSVLQRNKESSDNWFRQVRSTDKGLINGDETWSRINADSSWKEISVPGYWEDQGATGVHGAVWFKKEIDLSVTDTGGDALLELGSINDIDTTYFNGVQVGTNQSSYLARQYRIPAAILKTGKNIITVRIVSKAGKGGFVPGKTYRFQAAGRTISLSGNWKYKVGTSLPVIPAATILWYQPASMFNGMIAPLIPYTLKGMLWYQGEANTARPLQYRTLLTDLIIDWRAKWQQGDLPFLIVQLPNYMQPRKDPGESYWALLRESQAKVAATLPSCGLVVTIDAGEANDIHPSDKKTVGERLALMAEKIAYGKKRLVSSGPVYKSMKVRQGKIILSFDEAGGDLNAKGVDTLRQFAIAGEDRKFKWAHARIEGNTIVAWREDIPVPVAVRYAWADDPEGCNLYNKEGLPAAPFRTDDWATALPVGKNSKTPETGEKPSEVQRTANINLPEKARQD